MKEIDAYLPKSLADYQRRPTLLLKIYIPVAMAAVALLYINRPLPVAEANQTAAVPFEIREEKAGRYGIFEADREIAKLSLASNGTSKVVKVVSENGELQLRTRLILPDTVRIYDATGMRVGKIKSKKGRFDYRETTNSNLVAKDMLGRITSLSEAMFFVLPLSPAVRSELANRYDQGTLKFPSDDEAATERD